MVTKLEKQHRQESPVARGIYYALMSAVAGFWLGFAIGGLLGALASGAVVAILFGVMGAATGFAVGRWWGRSVKAKMLENLNGWRHRFSGSIKPSCACHGSAAEYLGYKEKVHTFTFVNQEYAKMFTEQNRQKVMP
jgi:hypothetical protein